jgi:hypothetical protein
LKGYKGTMDARQQRPTLKRGGGKEEKGECGTWFSVCTSTP